MTLDATIVTGLAMAGAAAIGAIAGSAFVVLCLRRGALSVRTVDLPRQLIALDRLDVTIAMKADDGAVVATVSHEAALSCVVNRVVEDWLDANGLVVQFKGPDFRPALRTTKGTP